MTMALRRRGQYGRSRRKGRIQRAAEAVRYHDYENVAGYAIAAVHLGSIFVAVYLAIKAQ